MPEWAIPILEQVPWGAIIIIVLWLGRGYQEKRDEVFATALRDTSLAIGAVEAAILANTAVLGEVKGAVSRLNGGAGRNAPQ
jgi:hypothetical protein